MRYIFIPLLIFICLVSPLSARRTVVINATSINSGSWVPGDTIVLKNGIWKNQTISLRAFGTASKPIVLIAQTPGDVIFNGSSRISISGQYIEVSGIYFKDGILSASVFEFRTSTTNQAENCRLTNCAIINYKAEIETDNTKWVSLYGKNNRVDNCTFENKTNIGTLLTVWLTPDVIPAHIIENNYFGYRDPLKDDKGNILNGQEIIRIGDSGTSMQYANCMFRNNFLEKCNGEGEIISNKSCGNIYSNNVFVECYGMLTLRHGNDCTVEGNYFFGNGAARTGGVRIIGEDHKVYNNYFENLTGTNFYAGLCLVKGKLNSLPYEYIQVKNAIVAFNTFVNCKESFCINYNSAEYTEPPIESVIAHNHIYNTNSTYTNVIVSQQDPNMDVVWKNNLMNQGKYTGFTYTPTQVMTGQKAQMEPVATPIPMLEPKTGSALANYTTNDYANVSSDIRGRLRNENLKIPGVSQVDGEVTREMPTMKTVGADFFKDMTSINPNLKEQQPFVLLNNLPGYMSIQSIVSGQVNVYDITGRSVESFKVIAHTRHEQNVGKGLFVVRLSSETGKSYVQKILL